MLSKEKIEYFAKKLEDEKKQLEEELGHIGKKNPDILGDWEVSSDDFNFDSADKSDLADSFEDLGNRIAIEDVLEEKLIYVNEALQRLKKKAYGVCLICKKPIQEKRLEAYPAAKHCIEHAKNNQ